MIEILPQGDFDRNIPISQLHTNFQSLEIVCGPFTYFTEAPNIQFGSANSQLRIGSFCSVAKGLTLVLHEHRWQWTTTYPIDDLLKKYTARASLPIKSGFTKGHVEIGNDVWIGHSVTLLSGVKIGDGAVIGANCVISKNIPPYAIVVGNPAKIIKYRFSDDIIERLLKLSWWTLTFNQLDEILPHLAEQPNKKILDELIAKYR